MRYHFQNSGKNYDLSLERQGERYLAVVDGQAFELEVVDNIPGQVSLRMQGRTVTLYTAVDGGEKWVALDGCTFRLERPAAQRGGTAAETGGGAAVRSPMPAQVRAIQVNQGDVVEKGQTLLILEAMKMEIRIKAPSAGRVKRLLVRETQAVEKDQPLAEIGE